MVAGLAALDRGDTEQALTHLLDAVRVADPELKDDLRSAMLGVFAQIGEHHPWPCASAAAWPEAL